MGDTGALALGGLIAGLAMATRTVLLLPILGGALRDHHDVGGHPDRSRSGPPANGCSAWSPLQHHFELAGWSEVNIVIRFWIIAGHRRGDRRWACSTATSCGS